MPETLIISNATIVTMDAQRRIIKDGAVAVEGPYIVDVGKTDEVLKRNRSDQRLVVSGKMVLPGLIDCHQHTTQMLARGLADDVDLGPWLYERILPYEAKITPEEVHVSALLCCAEMIRNGTTCFADPGGRHTEQVASAVDTTGLRGTVSEASADADISDNKARPEELPAGGFVKRTDELYRAFHNKGDGRVRVSASLRSDAMVSQELVVKIDELARQRGMVVQMHAANTQQRVAEFEGRHHMGVFEYFGSLGVLGPHWLLSHVASIRVNQLKVLAETRANVCHIPGSSLHGGYGASIHGKFPELLNEGVNVCLGCDAAAANNSLDMFIAMRQAATVHKEARASCEFVSPERAMEMATISGAKALMIPDVGSLERGKRADLIVVGARRPNSVPIHDFSIVPTLVYSITGADVETVFVDGRRVMHERRLLTLDEDDLVAKAQVLGERIVNRAGIRLKPRWPTY